MSFRRNWELDVAEEKIIKGSFPPHYYFPFKKICLFLLKILVRITLEEDKHDKTPKIGFNSKQKKKFNCK